MSFQLNTGSTACFNPPISFPFYLTTSSSSGRLSAGRVPRNRVWYLQIKCHESSTVAAAAEARASAHACSTLDATCQRARRQDHDSLSLNQQHERRPQHVVLTLHVELVWRQPRVVPRMSNNVVLNVVRPISITKSNNICLNDGRDDTPPP